jgi:hypothetical protein
MCNVAKLRVVMAGMQLALKYTQNEAKKMVVMGFGM